MSRFVGREDEIATLRAVVRAAGRRRRPSAAIVFGDPGVGKSGLLAEALKEVAGVRVVPVAGYQPEAAVPLAAVRSLLREAARAPRNGPRLQAMLHGAPAAGGDLAAVRLFESIHRCLAELAPVAIVADDLQWVDEVSLALCHFVLRAAASDGYGLALVAASREASAVRAFLASLAEVVGEGEELVVLDLEPLPASDGMRLLAELVPTIDDTSAADVYRRAGGSPFWLHALADASGALADVSSLVGRRMRGVSPDGAWLMALLATAGIPLTAVQLESVLDWPAGRIGAASGELVGVGLAVVDGVFIRLAHDLVRDGALASLPERDRRQLHRRLAETFAEHAGDDVRALSEAIEQRLAAGMPMLDLALRIARAPGRRLVGADGVRRLVRLLEPEAERREAEARASSVEGDRAALRRELAELAREVGLPGLAIDLWQVAATESSSSEAARASLQSARIAFLQLAEGDIAEQLLRQSRSAAMPDVALSIEQDVLESLIARHTRKDLPAASRIAARALTTAREAVAKVRGEGREPAPALRTAWLEALGGAYDEARLSLDDADLMLALAEEMLVAAGSSQEAVLSARFNLGMAFRAQGRWADAAGAFGEVWQRALDWTLPAVAASTGYWLGDALRALGRLQESRRIAQQTEGIARRVEDRRAAWDARWLLHVLDLSVGDWRSAIGDLIADLALELDPHTRIATHATVADWLARFGGGDDRQAIVEHLERGEEEALAAGCTRCRRELLVRAAETHARIGRLDRSAAALKAWEREGPARSTLSRFWQLRAGAVLAAVDDGRATACAAAFGELAAVVAAADGMEMRLEACHARLDLGLALVGQDRTRAVSVLRTAAADAAAIGAASEGRAASQALRRLGVRVRAPLSAAPTGEGDGIERLTPSELAVARLVASGASNREIAAALFITPKTVERHVSHVLAKLGLRNRTELAGRMHRLTSGSL